MEGLSKTDRVYAGDFGTPEQQIPASGLPGADWESCMTMNDTWGYKSYDENWKSPRRSFAISSTSSRRAETICSMSDRQRKERFPRQRRASGSDGQVDEGERRGDHGTTASPFATQLTWGRATRKGSRLYLLVFDWPVNGKLAVPAFGGTVLTASLLGSKSSPLTVTPTEGGFSVAVPDEPPDRIASVIALETRPARGR